MPESAGEEMCNEAELCFGEETKKPTNTLLQI